MPARFFDHEKLHFYQEVIRFVTWADPLTQSLPAKLSVRDQLDRAATSIPLNIAEGNGKFTPPDRCRFFDTSRGSTLECAACLDVLFVRKLAHEEQVVLSKEKLARIVQMLIGLLRKFSDRAGVLREEEPEYLIDYEHEHEQEHE